MGDELEKTQAYRGVVKRCNSRGTSIYYSRPYDKPGPAKAFVTRERKTKWGGNFEDGWVEYSTGWARLE